MSEGAEIKPAATDWRQLDYESVRARWREAYLAWLAARELPGTPRTVLPGGDL